MKRRFSTMAEKAVILEMLKEHLDHSDPSGQVKYHDPAIDDYELAKMVNERMNTTGLNHNHVAFVRKEVYGPLFFSAKGGGAAQERLASIDARIKRLEEIIDHWSRNKNIV